MEESNSLMLFIRNAWIAFFIALLPILSIDAADKALPIEILGCQGENQQQGPLQLHP